MADIRIYVADLAAYNSGKLHGVWIDATIELDEIQGCIQAMLKESLNPLQKGLPYTITKALALVALVSTKALRALEKRRVLFKVQIRKS